MKTLFILLLILPHYIFCQDQKPHEEYVDGRLIKTLNQKGVQVSSSLRSIERNDGKYYIFDISISNGSDKTVTFRVKDCKANIVNVNKKKLKKGKIDKAYDITELEIMRSKDYQKIKKKKQATRGFFKRWAAASAAEDAGQSSSTTTTNVNSTSYKSGNSNAEVNVYDEYGNKLGKATVNQNNSELSSTNTNLSSSTVNRDGAAVYNARQNEERKLQEYYNQQQEARIRWNEAYLKSNTLSPFESCSGLLNIKFKDGDYLEIYIIVEELIFVFNWDPEDSEN